MADTRQRRSPRGLLVFCVLSVLLITGCGQQRTGEESAKPKVVASFTVLADIAQSIAGDYLEVESLTKPGAEIHEYEPTPLDVKRVQGADLVLRNGLGLDTWFDRFMLDSARQQVVVSEGVQPIAVSQESGSASPNPHAWMSPSAATVYVNNIVQAFVDLDPVHAHFYRQQARDYRKALDKIHRDLVEQLQNLPEQQKVLVTCEGAFSYLARDIGFQEEFLWPVNSDGQVSARRIAEVSDRVKQRDIPAVFCESTVSAASMKQVAAESSATFAATLFVDSLSKPDGPVPSYLDLLRYDAQALVQGLAG
ncbi:MAG: metal ABC transporter substrate-binding protein [Rothia sp. (in: high G+C Gram-positive bacteria)]|nr:metal ABC transporter substrate-binding protein [Rothia sp. (in: high G+C Gram-positive bacteria)]